MYASHLANTGPVPFLSPNADGSLQYFNRYAATTDDPSNLVVTSTYGYDDAGRLISLSHVQNSTTLADYQWALDPAGRVTDFYSYDDTASGRNLSDHTTWGHAQYGYDNTNQIKTATYANWTNPPAASGESYAYDPNGNRQSANGQLYCQPAADNLMTSDGTYTYSYDAEGNRTAKFIDANQDRILDAGDTDITIYQWDNRNRLAKVSHFLDYSALAANTADKVVQYSYDAADRLVGENIDSNGDGVVDHETRFVYDGSQIVMQFDKDVSGATDLAVSDLSHRYLWGPVVDQLLADEDVVAATVRWPLADNLGTVRDLAVYSAGVTTVVTHRVYDTYGNLTSATGTVDCLFGYTSRPYDKATGLQNNWHRWYDATTGGWLGQDPDNFDAGDTNLTRYVGNGPVNCTDPSGLDWLKGDDSPVGKGDDGFVWNDSEDDTVAGLAQQVGYYAGGYRRWLHGPSGGEDLPATSGTRIGYLAGDFYVAPKGKIIIYVGENYEVVNAIRNDFPGGAPEGTYVEAVGCGYEGKSLQEHIKEDLPGHGVKATGPKETQWFKSVVQATRAKLTAAERFAEPAVASGDYYNITIQIKPLGRAADPLAKFPKEKVVGPT